MKKGFTLVEILVSISIIAILMAISFFGIQGARASARDTIRKADLEKIRAGLEFYKSDCGGYTYTVTAGSPIMGTGANCPVSASSNTYLAAYPADPIPTKSYSYSPNGCIGTPPVCSTYKVWAYIEGGSTPTTNCGTAPSCGDATCNFCVTNP